MKKIFYFVLVLLLALAFATVWLWFKRTGEKETWQQKLDKATQFLRSEEYVKAWQVVQDEKSNQDPEVQYLLFLASFGAEYYAESLDAWQKLPSDLQQKQSAQTFAVLAAYAQQSEQHTLRDQLINLAVEKYPDEAVVKELKDWKFPAIFVKTPANSAVTYEDGSFLDRSRIQVAIEQKDWSEAQTLLEAALKTGLHAADVDFVLPQLAQIYIETDQLSSYQELLSYVKQNRLNLDLPSYFGNSLSNFMNGGDYLLHQNKLFTSRYYSNHLAYWPAEFLRRNAQEYANTKIMPEVLLESPITYLNGRIDDLYFVSLKNGSQIGRYSLSTGEWQILIGRAADQLFLAGSSLYYRDLENKHIYRYHLASGTEEALVARATKSYLLTGNGLYFINADRESQIQFYQFSDGTIKTIIEDRVDAFVSDGNRLVYINGSDENRIWQADMRGEQAGRLLDWTDCSGLHLTDDGNLYFSQWFLHRLAIRSKKLDQLSEYKALRVHVAGERVFFANENFDGHRYIALPDENQSFVVEP